MSTTTPRGLIEITYYNAAQEYLRSLPLEHFMEAVPQATQRKITVASLELVHAVRPDVQPFNELLVQYPRPGERRPGQIVPDNMVVVCGKPISAETSFDVPLQPVGPYWVMEYVSKRSKRKDYEESYDKYEQELRVPSYLVFYPDTQDLTLYRLSGKHYRSVKPNGDGRCALSELELEVGLLDGWVRFWFRGKLLPLPAELLRELTATREQLTQTLQKLGLTEDRLGQTEDRLGQTEQRLGQTEDRLGQTEDRLGQTEQRLGQTEQRLGQTEQQRDELQRRLAELEQELARVRPKPTRSRKRPSDRS